MPSFDGFHQVSSLSHFFVAFRKSRFDEFLLIVLEHLSERA